MKILIIGAYGFLGTHILKELLQNSVYDIHVLVKESSEPKFNLKGSYTKHIYGSIGLNKALKAKKIEVIINCSVCYGKYENSSLVYKTNFILPTEIIELLNDSIKVFINFDSYFNKEEFKNYKYLEDYIKSKLFFISSIDPDINYSFFNLRIEHLYGLYDSDHKFFYKMYSNIRRNKPSIDLTDGNQKRDFIYIKDLVDLVIMMLEKNYWKKGKKIFSVGTGNSISIKDCLELMKNELNSKTILNFGSIALRKNEIMDSKSSYKNLNSEYGWTPKFNLREGIINMIENDK